MKIHIIILILLLGSSSAFAQGVGVNTEDIHKHAILSIKNSEEAENDATKSKAMKFPSVSDMTQLLRYDPNEPDNYQDDPTIVGMINYVEDQKKLMYYNGKTWMPLFSSSGDYTEVQCDQDKTFPIILAIPGASSIRFGKIVQDGLRIASEDFYIDPEDAERVDTRVFNIVESGMYDITLSLLLEANGLTTWGGIEVEVRTFVNNTKRNTHNVKLNDSFLGITVGERSRSALTFPMYLQQGDVVRFNVTFPWDNLFSLNIPIGAGVKVCAGSETYVTFRKVL